MLFAKNMTANHHSDMEKNINRRDLTVDEKEAQVNLLRIWNEFKKKYGITQESAAHEMGFKTQGAVSHYLNGKIPLNISAILSFSKLLKVSPFEISNKLIPSEIVNSGTVEMSVADSIGEYNFQELGTSSAEHKSGVIIRRFSEQQIRNVPVMSIKQLKEGLSPLDVNRDSETKFIPTPSASSLSFAIDVAELATPNDRFGIEPGVYIVIDPSADLENGKLIYVKDINGIFSIKRYEIVGSKRYIAYYQDRYEPVLLDDAYCILGRIVWECRSH